MVPKADQDRAATAPKADQDRAAMAPKADQDRAAMAPSHPKIVPVVNRLPHPSNDPGFPFSVIQAGAGGPLRGRRAPFQPSGENEEIRRGERNRLRQGLEQASIEHLARGGQETRKPR